METQINDGSQDKPVLVIGAAGLDIIGRLKSSLLENHFLERKSNPADIRVSYGGVGRNVAENLARLGQTVHLLSAFGKDYLGLEMIRHTAACGVNILSCLKSDRYLTSSYLAILDQDGNRSVMLEDMGILEEITPEYIRSQKELFVNSSLIFLDANLSPKTMKAVLSIARKNKVPVCADAASPLLAERLLPFLEDLYMVSANSAEASVLCQSDPVISNQETALQAARHLIAHGVELAVIAIGQFGVVYATSETNGHIPAVQTRILDPTGAGDALTATVIFGLLNQISIDESIRLGVTAASLTLRHRGTVFPDLSLEKLYDELLA
jgi:pseudouridine kinase